MSPYANGDDISNFHVLLSDTDLLMEDEVAELPPLTRSGVLSVRLQLDLLQVLSQRTDGLVSEGDTAGALRQVGAAHQAELAKVSIGTPNPTLLAGLHRKLKDLESGARLGPRRRRVNPRQ